MNEKSLRQPSPYKDVPTKATTGIELPPLDHFDLAALSLVMRINEVAFGIMSWTTAAEIIKGLEELGYKRGE
jgi:hypothetical protein